VLSVLCGSRLFIALDLALGTVSRKRLVSHHYIRASDILTEREIAPISQVMCSIDRL